MSSLRTTACDALIVPSENVPLNNDYWLISTGQVCYHSNIVIASCKIRLNDWIFISLIKSVIFDKNYLVIVIMVTSSSKLAWLSRHKNYKM